MDCHRQEKRQCSPTWPANHTNIVGTWPNEGAQRERWQLVGSINAPVVLVRKHCFGGRPEMITRPKRQFCPPLGWRLVSVGGSRQQPSQNAAKRAGRGW
jgi:hypothetical protein